MDLLDGDLSLDLLKDASLGLLLVRSRDPSRDLLGDLSLAIFGELSLDLLCDLSLELSFDLLFDLSLEPSFEISISLSSRLVRCSARTLLDELSVELPLLIRTLTESVFFTTLPPPTQSSDSLLRLLVSRGKAPLLARGGGEGESPGASYSGESGASYTGDPSTSEATGD